MSALESYEDQSKESRQKSDCINSPHRESESSAPPSGNQRSRIFEACSWSCLPSILLGRSGSAGSYCTWKSAVKDQHGIKIKGGENR